MGAGMDGKRQAGDRVQAGRPASVLRDPRPGTCPGSLQTLGGHLLRCSRCS